MLSDLHIENFALIENLTVGFSPGFNVITGETGAGKSIIIDAMEVLLGGRPSAEMIRTGASRAFVEGRFQVRGEEVILSRELFTSGRSSARINGRVVSTATLKEMGASLVDIHGQHEHQSLLEVDNHLLLLDGFGGKELLEARNRFESLYAEYVSAAHEVRGLLGNQRDQNRQMDLLEYQINEIDSARLVPGEEEELVAERRILVDAEMLKTKSKETYCLLYEGNHGHVPVVDCLAKVISELESIQGVDQRIEGPLSQLNQALFAVEDAAREIKAWGERIAWDPERLREIEERLDLISNLKRKYGDTIAGILEYRIDMSRELECLRNSEGRAALLTQKLENLKMQMAELVPGLTLLRKEAAKRLEGMIESQLADLGMASTEFKVEITQEDDPQGLEVQGRPLKIGPRGADRVEFLISPNPGEGFKPLVKIASGGELSRITLAIKSVLSQLDPVDTLIFDEIDVGIGGKVARQVGLKMSQIASSKQVLCVTHHPQIACLGSSHFLVSKNTYQDRTTTAITRLSPGDREKEIARMLSGTEITPTTLRHAQEMLSHS